jgi:hypothetical protein
VAPDVASVTPLITGSALLQQQGQVGYRTGITGTTANYADVTDLDLVVGSFFDEQQERSKAKVVVLGPRPVTELFAGNAGEAIGQRIRIGRTTFRVIGVAKPAQNDDVAYLPFDAARSYVLGGTDEVDSVIVAAGSAQAVPAALQQVTAVLDDRHRITDSTERDFDVRAQQDFIDQASQFLTFLTLFTSAIAGISLIVGGIGGREHHAGVGHRADPRDRHPQGHRRHPPGDPAAVPAGVDGARRAGRYARRAGRAGPLVHRRARAPPCRPRLPRTVGLPGLGGARPVDQPVDRAGRGRLSGQPGRPATADRGAALPMIAPRKYLKEVS